MPSGTKLVISKGGVRKIWTNQLDYLKRTVVPALKKSEYSVLFWVKVNCSDFPEYPKIVRKAMDFALVESRLKEHYYTCAAECIDDIETVFTNCCVFNQAAEDITLIGEHILRKRYHEKMECFPKEEMPVEKKKRPGRRRQPASPLYSEPEDHVATRRHSLESVDSQSNPAPYNMPNDSHSVSPSNGEKKGQIRNALISRITKDQSSNSTFTISSAPPRREREARPQMGTGAQTPAGTSVVGAEVSKPHLKLCPSLTKCQKVVSDMLNYRRRRFNWPFLEPVDPVALNIPDYFEIVKNPMDLSTIKQKLDSGVYKHKNEVKNDVDLMIANCTLYNGPNSQVAQCGQDLLAFFTKKFMAIPDDPPDMPPILDGKRKRNKSHKNHKAHKRHKRDRLEEEMYRLQGLVSPEVPELGLEDQGKLHNLVGQLNEVIMRMSSEASEYDNNNKFVNAGRERLSDETLPVSQNIGPTVREMQGDLNLVRSVDASVYTPPLSNGTGRPAGRPRKRNHDGEDADPTFVAGKSTSTGSGRGKRKRMNMVQPTLSTEEAARLPPIPVTEMPSPLEEALGASSRKPTVKPVVKEVHAGPSASTSQTLLNKEEPVQEKFEAAAVHEPVIPHEEHILTYEEKAALSLELQRVTDATVLHELGAIVQQYEPSVQSASSGELDVDLSTLSNVTLLALKKVLDRSRETSVATVAVTTAANAAQVAAVEAATTAAASAVPVPHMDSEEDLDDDYEEPNGESHQLAGPDVGVLSAAGDSAGRMGNMGAPDNISGPTEPMYNATSELSNVSSDVDACYSDSKPRGRRNARKTSHPVRHRGAGAILNQANTASNLSLAESEKSNKFEDSSANETDTTVPMMDSMAMDNEMSGEAPMREPEPVTDLSTRPHLSPAPTSSKAVREQVKKNVLAKAALPTGNRRGKVERKSEVAPEPKMETSTPVSKKSPGLSHLTSDDDDNLDNSDNEGEHSPRGSDGESKPLVGQANQRRPVYDIFKEDEGSRSEAKKRHNTNTNEEALMQLQAKYKSVIYNNKSERINRELERENEVRERREEEEKRKRDDEERKRKEEQEKEARKEALKEQERRRLNEIRARNRRADMPLRQYADMANFEKQLDYSLINPRWF